MAAWTSSYPTHKGAIDRYIVVAAREVVLKGDGSPEERRLWNQYGEKFIAKKEKGKFLLPQRRCDPWIEERWPFSRNMAS